MSRTTILSLIAVVILALFISFLFTTGSTRTVEDQPASTTDSSAGITRTVDGLHQFNADNETHIVAGTTTVPTPCHRLETQAEVSTSSDPDRVVVSFDAVQSGENEICAQVVTESRFKLAVEAEESAEIVGGTFGPDTLNLNLRDVPAGESLEDYEVYTKG